MTYVLLTHVRASAPLYQFGCYSDLVMVTKEPVRGFPGLWGSQEPYSDKYKTGGEGQNFTVILGLWGTFSNIYQVFKELGTIIYLGIKFINFRSKFIIFKNGIKYMPF